MALFVSGERRIVYMGGRVGIHSCSKPDGAQAPECNKDMAANALAHGVPWAVIETFGNKTKPSSMMWLGAEEAECWGLMKWGAEDTSNDGLACFQWAMLTKDKRGPAEVTAKNANYILCRMNAGTSLIYVSTDRRGQGFSDAYRRACERIAADPKTPKYAAIDIIMWLTLTDPDILALKPGTLMAHIVDNGDENDFSGCWKCFTIFGMSMFMHEYPREALDLLQKAVNAVKRDTGSVPAWLASRVDLAAAEAAKTNR